jgi:capsular polysaccharide transport system permease protein
MTSGTSSLLQSFAIQRRVIRALLLRELITRFGRENLGVLWLVGEPMIFTLGVAALWTAIRAHQFSSLPIFAFAITGYSSVLLWRNTVGRCIGGIDANASLLYHRNVRVMDVYATRILLEVGGATASFLVLVVIFTATESMEPPVDPLSVVFGWAMLAWFGAALGVTVGSAATFSHLVDRVWHPVSYLMFPLSGAAFMVEWLPPAGREVVLLLPMVHAVELIREGFFGNVVPTHYDLGYVAKFNLILTLAGLFLMHAAARRVGER